MLGTNLSAANIPTQPSTRYAAVFVVLLFAAVASGIRLRSARSRRLLIALALTVGVLVGGRLALWSALSVKAIGAPAPAQGLWDVVVALRDSGIGSGSPVAILGRKGEHVFWARLGRIRIISQVPDAEAFLHAGPAVQGQVLDVLARTGAMALIADSQVASHPGQPWQRLGATRYYAIGLAGRERPR